MLVFQLVLKQPNFRNARQLTTPIIPPLMNPRRFPFSISGLHWAVIVQRGGFLFKEFWTRIVFWPDTCLVELTKSYVQFQSLMFR